MLAVLGLAVAISMAAWAGWNWMEVAAFLVAGYWAMKLWIFRTRYRWQLFDWIVRMDQKWLK